VNIKAQGLLNAVKWIEESHGLDAVRDVVRACSPEVRDRYTSAIAINWHPMGEFVEFLGVADRLLGKNDGKLAELVGEAGARVSLKGSMVRLAFYIGRPEYLLKRIAGLWRQFNDQGEMVLLSFDDQRVVIEVHGVDTPQWLFCCTITGWAREIVRAMGGTHPIARHSECRARGQSRCVYEVRWTGATAAELGKEHVSKGAASFDPSRFGGASSTSPPELGAPKKK
jgi:hypothetical protein